VAKAPQILNIRTKETMTEPTYKVLRLTTEGYTEVDTLNAVNLTKPQCDQVIRNLIADGVNPREIKAVRDN
tara:strand:- start:1127 stop:1339 length:213 start_codon:yes stop_codon:yes gene_type:complete